MTYAKRVDQNQPRIVAALRKAGRPVQVTSGVGHDFPDILTQHIDCRLVLLELKNPERRGKQRELRPGQQAFALKFPGSPIVKVETEEDALRAVGLLA